MLFRSRYNSRSLQHLGTTVVSERRIPTTRVESYSSVQPVRESVVSAASLFSFVALFLGIALRSEFPTQHAALDRLLSNYWLLESLSFLIVIYLIARAVNASKDFGSQKVFSLRAVGVVALFVLVFAVVLLLLDDVFAALLFHHENKLVPTLKPKSAELLDYVRGMLGIHGLAPDAVR